MTIDNSTEMIILKNQDGSHTAQVKVKRKWWFQKKIFGIYYVPEFCRPFKNLADDYYITISDAGEGQTSVHYSVISQMFRNFKKQYKLSGIPIVLNT